MVHRGWLIGILLLAGALRASHARDPAEYIERHEFIPAALTLAPDHLPVRVAQHGALPAYLIRASGEIFGETTVGWRVLSIVAGLGTVLLVYLIAVPWWGPAAGLIGAGLLAVERYHSEISARAIDLPFDLFFVALAFFAFSRFMWAAKAHPARPAATGWLLLAALACGLGFLCKEFTALLWPTLLASLFFTGLASWWRRRQLWLAMALFVAVISPDLYSNLTITPQERQDLWLRHERAAAQLGADLPREFYSRTGLYMSYGDQLSRFRSVSLNAEPVYLYLGGFLDWLGVPHQNRFGEFPYMYPVIGALVWIGVLTVLMRRRKDPLSTVLAIGFVASFVPFTLVRLGMPRAQFPTDADVLWYWVDRSMLPAMLLTGYAVASFVRGWLTGGVPGSEGRSA